MTTYSDKERKGEKRRGICMYFVRTHLFISQFTIYLPVAVMSCAILNAVH